MSISYPAALDSFTNPLDTDDLTNHHVDHGNLNDAVEALEAKVGIDGSSAPASHTYKIAILQ